MKKILFLLVALIASMSMNAQVMTIKKNGAVVKTYTTKEADEVTFEYSTIGAAQATINGSEVEVIWVQLWENGPKFAEHNIGASKASEKGSTLTFAQATMTDNNYAWGSNWRTPTKDELNEFYKATYGGGSTKVTCTYTTVDGVKGFRFTGRETGYTSNSIFIPVQDFVSSVDAYIYLWSSTVEGSNNAQSLRIYRHSDGTWYDGWYPITSTTWKAHVRPVLKED